jgi:Domain of unknown function (DUF6766)
MNYHSHLRRWGAAYLLLALFLASWIGQFVAMLIESGNQAREHDQPFRIGDFWVQFLSATFENWQSEWLQLLIQAVVLLGMKHLIFKADAVDMEQVQLDLAEIKQRLGIPPRDELTTKTQAELAKFGGSSPSASSITER